VHAFSQTVVVARDKPANAAVFTATVSAQVFNLLIRHAASTLEA
jgi:hypothetical protein